MTKDQSPLISVIIPTYKREEMLRQTLAEVLKQDYQNFEIIVVDQTPIHQPETVAYLEELAKTGKIKIFQVNWANLPGARNFGVRRSRGEIILFIDDDVQLPEGFLTAHAKNYKRKDIGAIAGRVLDRMKLANSGGELIIDYLPEAAMDPGIAWYYIDLVHTVKPQQVISARGCNMSFRRDIFNKYNLKFDERFEGTAVREESDFCLGIRATGLIIWYDPEAYLIHLGEETGGCHDISTRSADYQVNLYHNHFLMAFKHLTFTQQLHLFYRLFDCQVLGHPPCNKSASPIKTLVRAIFYILGFVKAIITIIKSIWNDGQIYTHQNP